jgi:hypothetical protein
VYNKYIGNSGKFIRVEEHPRVNAHNAERSAAKPPPQHSMPQHIMPEHLIPEPAVPQQLSARPVGGSKTKPTLFGGLGGGLSNLLGGKGLGGGPGGLTDGFRGMFDHLPFGLDIGDILLFLLLLFFFIESGDEEFIIILAVIAYSMFKER